MEVIFSSNKAFILISDPFLNSFQIRCTLHCKQTFNFMPMLIVIPKTFVGSIISFLYSLYDYYWPVSHERKCIYIHDEPSINKINVSLGLFKMLMHFSAYISFNGVIFAVCLFPHCTFTPLSIIIEVCPCNCKVGQLLITPIIHLRKICTLLLKHCLLFYLWHGVFEACSFKTINISVSYCKQLIYGYMQKREGHLCLHQETKNNVPF